MKITKKILALLLSVIISLSAVCSVPFTVAAKEVELTEAGDSFISLGQSKYSAAAVDTDVKYMASMFAGSDQSGAMYGKFTTGDADAYYVLTAKCESGSNGNDEAVIEIIDNEDSVVSSVALTVGNEGKAEARLTANTEYYIRAYYSSDSAYASGIISFTLTAATDAEPDTMINTIKIGADEEYKGSIATATDQDWVFVATNSTVAYNVVVKNNNADVTNGFKVDVYNSISSVVKTITTNSAAEATVQLDVPVSNESYYICVTGVEGTIGDYSVKFVEPKPDTAEVPLEEDYYGDITGCGTVGGTDYLSFTTLSEDAYYFINVKNIDIETHSWSADLYLYIDILNADGERLDRIRLRHDTSGTATLRLEPDTTYYVNIYNKYGQDKKGGNYKVNITYTLDPEKNEQANGVELKLGEKYNGNIAARGDNDWFKITTGETTQYDFYLKNITIKTHSWSSDLRFRAVLYNEFNEVINDKRHGQGGESTSRVTLFPNTTYYVRVWDPEGTSGDYHVALTQVYPDVETEKMAMGTLVGHNSDYLDRIEKKGTEGDVDYLKFDTTDKKGFYIITAQNKNIATGTATTEDEVQVLLRDINKNELYRFCLSSGETESKAFTLDLSTTYYLKVYNSYGGVENGGDYTIRIDGVLDPEMDTAVDCAEVKINKDGAGTIGAPGDVDFFKFTTSKEKAFYYINARNASVIAGTEADEDQLQVAVYNVNNEELGKMALSFDEQDALLLNLAPETAYYLRFSNKNSGIEKGGDYSFNINSVVDPEMDTNVDCATIELGKDVKGSVNVPGDVDYFAFNTTNENDEYTLSVLNGFETTTTLTATIYDAAGTELGKVTYVAGGENATTIALARNTAYYVAVSDAVCAGEYTFRIDPVMIDKDLVGMSNAVELPYDEEHYDDLAEKKTEGDTDYFKFTTLEEKAYYYLYAKNITIPTGYWSDSGVQFIIMNEHKEEIGRIAIAGVEEKTSTFALDANTTYYLKVVNVYDNEDSIGGNYKVKLTYITDPEPEETANGKTLALGEKYYGNLGAIGDVDCFTFTTGEDKDYSFALKNINIDTYWDGFIGAIYNSYGEELYKIAKDIDDQVSVKAELDPNTTYYIKLWTDQEDRGDYMVCVDKCVLLGDANLDGAVKIQDATLIQKFLANFVTIDETQKKVSDVNGDGNVNIKDATAIQKYLADIDTGLPIGENI